MTDTDLPCLDRPGNIFRLSVYKPQGRPAYAVATEGRLKHETYNGHEYTSFEMELFGKDRRHTVPLGGTNTPKRRANALLTLLNDLEDKGWVAKGWGVSTD